MQMNHRLLAIGILAAALVLFRAIAQAAIVSG